MEDSSTLLEAINCEQAAYNNLPADVHSQSVALLSTELDLELQRQMQEDLGSDEEAAALRNDSNSDDSISLDSDEANIVPCDSTLDGANISPCVLKLHKAIRWKVAAAVSKCTWKNQFRWTLSITNSVVTTCQRWAQGSHKWKIQEYVEAGHYRMSLVMQQSRSNSFRASRQRKWYTFSQRRACRRCRKLSVTFVQKAEAVIKSLTKMAFLKLCCLLQPVTRRSSC